MNTQKKNQASRDLSTNHAVLPGTMAKLNWPVVNTLVSNLSSAKRQCMHNTERNHELGIKILWLKFGFIFFLLKVEITLPPAMYFMPQLQCFIWTVEKLNFYFHTHSVTIISWEKISLSCLKFIKKSIFFSKIRKKSQFLSLGRDNKTSFIISICLSCF